MIEYEVNDSSKEFYYKYSLNELADRLAPADSNKEAIAKNEAGAMKLQRERLRVESEGSLYVSEDLAKAMRAHTYGNMGNIVAHALLYTKALTGLNEDAQRRLFRYALEDDIAVLSFEVSSKVHLHSSGEIYPGTRAKKGIKEELLNDLNSLLPDRRLPLFPPKSE